jgi:hypothetical protein
LSRDVRDGALTAAASSLGAKVESFDVGEGWERAGSRKTLLLLSATALDGASGTQNVASLVRQRRIILR